jgi:hypothetical protein
LTRLAEYFLDCIEKAIEPMFSGPASVLRPIGRPGAIKTSTHRAAHPEAPSGNTPSTLQSTHTAGHEAPLPCNI